MNPVVVRNIKIGEGIPKICVSLVGKTEEEIQLEAEMLRAVPKDLVEWRADWFDGIFESERVENILKILREQLDDVPLLFTLRTCKEGGEKEVSQEEYLELNRLAIESHLVDLVDVEMLGEAVLVKHILAMAHQNEVLVVGSNHDFDGTPSKEELVRRLCFMQEAGADILKIAVMPKSKQDVITLLAATEEMKSNYAKQPIVTVSMSEEGVLSRIAGEIFGSAITFGSLAKGSAPGQIPATELKETLGMIHHLVENR